MKKFIKERNPFLLVSFIFSIVLFIYDVLIFSSLGKLLSTIIDGYSITSADLPPIIFVTLVMVLLLFITLFIIIGFLYKKEEYIIVSILLLIVLSSMYIFNDINTVSFIAIIWCIVNVLGLMKIKK